MNSVAVIILNWNRIKDTISCLDSLRNQTYTNYKIVLIDNGSTEEGTRESLDMLKQKYGDKLTIIYNTKNDGFAGGVNIGIRFALKGNYDYVALLNNDAKTDDKWLDELVNAAKANDSSITTGLLLNGDGKKIDSTGDWYSIWGLPFPRNRGDKREIAPRSQFVFGASGGASLYKTILFQDIGFFDESFFAYYEDVDISFRAQLYGHKVYYTDKAIVYHQQGASTASLPGFAVMQTFKNLPILFIKNVPRGLIFKIGLRFFVAYHLMLGKALVSRRGLDALKGWFRGLMLFLPKLQERRNIQKNRKRSTAEIEKIIWQDLPPDQTGLRKLFS